MKKRALCIFMAVVLLVSMFPSNVFAAHDSTGKPLDLSGDVYLALYIGGNNFPGEPAEYAVSGYLNLNSSFGSTGFGKFAESAENILEEDILDDVVQGTSGVWGVFSTTGGSRYLLPSSGIVDGNAGDVNKPHNAETEKKIIQTAIDKGYFSLGTGESIDDYTIIWYVIKYQRSDSAWHIDGLITKKTTYSVNYYGNGNTSGSAPTGVNDLQDGDTYTVLPNTGSLRKVSGSDTYIFNGWNTSPEGTGTHYDPGQTIVIDGSNVNLYAEWYLVNRYTVSVTTKLDDTERNIEDILGEGTSLYVELQEEGSDGGEYIPLTKSGAGAYSTKVSENGAYHIWICDADGNYEKLEGYQITVYNQNGHIELPYYSVSYDVNADGDTVTWSDGSAPETTCYLAATSVTDAGNIPSRNGYTFKGWMDQNQNWIDPGANITGGILEPTVLTAQWEKNIKVTVHVNINHNDGKGGYNPTADRFEAELQFLREENNVNLPLDLIALDPSLSLDTVLPLDPDSISYVNDEENHITTYTLTFTDLPQGLYNATGVKHGYVSTETRQGAADSDQVITVNLQYAPEDFDLEFDVVVKADDATEKTLMPQAVNVKVLYWGYDDNKVLGWHTITQQAGEYAPTTVYIDPQTGKGTGFFPVWKYWADGSVPSDYAYEYRVEVTSFVMPDGSVVAASGNLETYTPVSNGLYKAKVTVEGDGRTPQPQSNALEGAYFDGSGQSGTPTVTVDINLYQVSFVAYPGKLNGKQQLLLSDQYQYPDLDQYIPVPVSEDQTFVGWVKDGSTEIAENQHGEYLTGHVRYTAQYKPKIQVSGRVWAAGTYEQDGETGETVETVVINAVDRIEKAMVILQKNVNGVYNDVASFEVEFFYPALGEDGYCDYGFTDLPNDGSEYRIVVLARNYSVTYENESDAESDSYSPDENLAVLGNNNVATVDAYLSHAPESYDQLMKVDASKISEAYRPNKVLSEILYRDIGDIHHYAVISQHTVAPYGVPMELSDAGFGDGSYSVWQYHTNGTRYEYQMNVTMLYGNVEGVFDQNGTKFDSDTAPYTIQYEPAAYYNIATGTQSHTLKATLVPKEYEIRFDMGLEEGETVLGMDNYLTDGGTEEDYYSYLHTWSYGNVITAFPYREGYVFEGWTSSDEEGVQFMADTGEIVIAEGLAKDVTLTANWRRLEGVSYIVRYLELNTEKPLRGAWVCEGIVEGTTVSSETNKQHIDGYTYAGAKIGDKMYTHTEEAVLTVTADPSKNVLTLYYVKEGYSDQVESNLKLDKTAILENNGTYTINLETYTMDNPVTTMILQNTPLDIVLVLDQSGSIVQDGYLDELQAAVDNFVQEVADHGRHNEVDHRIAIVGYASDDDAGYTDKDYPLAGGTLNEWVNTGVFDSNGDFHPYPVTGFAYQEYTGVVDPEKGTYYTSSDAHNDAFLLLSYHEEYRHLITEAEARVAVLNGTKVYGYVYDEYDIGEFVELTRNASGMWLYGDKQVYSAKEFFTYHTDVWTHRHGLEPREIHAYGTGSNYTPVDGHGKIFTRQETEGDEEYKLNIYEDALIPVSVGANGSGGTNPNLLKATKSLGSNGGTYVQYGVEMANKIFAANKADGRVRVMVTFTDGKPGNSGFDETVANDAIAEAYKTKNEHEAYVYTIGLYPSTGVDSTSDIAIYMNAMSSNYPEADSMDDVMRKEDYVVPPAGARLGDGGNYYVYEDDKYYQAKYGTVTIWFSRTTCWYYSTDSFWSPNTRISTESSPEIVNGRVGNYEIRMYQPAGYVEPTNTGFYSTTESEQDLKAYFANIMTEITTNITTEIVLHGDTILRDIMGQGLVFTPNTVITAYKVGGHYNASTGQVEWSATKEKVAELLLKDQEGPEVSSKETTDITFTNEDGTVTTRKNVPYLTVYNYDKNVSTTDADNPHTVDITGYDFENNYIKEGHDGYKMVIEITSVEARDNVQWGRSTATNHERSGLWLPADEGENRQLLMAFDQPTTIFVERAYVLDYGKEFILSDWYFDDENGENATPIHLDFDITNGMNGFDTPNRQNAKDSAYGNTQYGNVNLDQQTEKVTYSPTSMSWGGYDSFYVFGNTWRKTVKAQDANENGNLWNKVTVIPANNIYYEDSFITKSGENGANGIEGFWYSADWQTVFDNGAENAGQNVEKPEHLESAPYGDVHGWTDTLGDDKHFTDGSAHAAGLPDMENRIGATAQFTFTGTGVDVYSRTNSASGLVIAMLYQQVTKEDGTVELEMIDGIVQDDLAVSGDYYHVPTISFDVPYGTYTVELIATMSSDTITGAFRYEYYLDGVRIYNPLGQTTKYHTDTVQAAYGLENNAVFKEVRDILLDYGDFNPGLGNSTDGKMGAVFIDWIREGQGSNKDQPGIGVPTYEIGTFESYGPKNEVYLTAGQAIVMKVETGNTYYVGMKSLTGNAVQVNVSGIDLDQTPTTIEIAHTTDMYYRVNPIEDYIVIQNANTSGDEVLSITNLRTTNTKEPAVNAGILAVQPKMAVMMMRRFSARLLAQETESGGPVQEVAKTPAQLQAEATIAFANDLFVSVRQWLKEED